jgi:hypothetical protein
MYYRALVYGEDIRLYPPPDWKATRLKMTSLVEKTKKASAFGDADE